MRDATTVGGYKSREAGFWKAAHGVPIPTPRSFAIFGQDVTSREEWQFREHQRSRLAAYWILEGSVVLNPSGLPA
jgi:hypothetical protein